ncbi:hypothetical protein FE257_001278 [Aspergillus nanangensis]|uniref:3-phytase n=1 Tax=Aspergillus nanangensis TaxID=2582783 RepID=A0AAD4GQW7_ASPNN|nr:hypothetical protein FE257_001278 [Aspergillus nanangensis]
MAINRALPSSASSSSPAKVRILIMRATLSSFALLAIACKADASEIRARAAESVTIPVPASSTTVDWFQTSPQSYQGPTATGVHPFLAQSNPAPFGQKTYTANEPLETNEPIKGAHGRNIFHHLGDLSPYFSPEDGFGVDEYPLPQGSNITQMHMIHRHGSRYPSSSEDLASWGSKISQAVASGNKFTGALSFLNDWSYGLGAEILVPQGRLELFESGVLNYYNYGQLLNTSSPHKLVVRTTTQDRMLKSAENFLAGFFGLDWTSKASLLAMVEGVGFNNSLIGTYSCPHATSYMASDALTKPTATWISIYLAERTSALRKLTGSYNWTVSDTHNAQTLCAYETVSYGYSSFCQLFTFAEFEGFGYVMDLMFASMVGFQNPAGRAQGIAWVEEFLARVEGHTLQTTATNANMTLDTNPETFPVDQKLYLDFSHDAGVVAALTAFGFRQFAQFLPPTGPPRNHQFQTSKIVPFAGRTNIEIIRAPQKVVARRSGKGERRDRVYVEGTGETSYVHFLQNQRTLPLHASFPECEYRDDGWCELDTFMAVQKKSLEKAKFECFIVRHGETEWSLNGRHTGTTDLPLTANGEKRMKATGKALVGNDRLIVPNKIAHVYVSPRHRAQRTFELLELGCRERLPWNEQRKPECEEPIRTEAHVEVTDAVREWDYGDYEGLTSKQIAELREKNGQGDWEIWRDGCPGGESPEDVICRLDALIAEIRAKYHGPCLDDKEPKGDILVVAHGHILRAFAMRWTKKPLYETTLILEAGGVGTLSYEHHNIHEPAVILGGAFVVPS